MFESVFGKVGKKVSRNSGKVIIAWIIILVIVAPFSITFFHNVNFNIASNIVSKNSMSYKASTLLSDEFGGNSSNGSSSNQIIIFSNNTNLNDITDSQTILSLQRSLNRTLTGVSGFSGIDSIFTTMKEVLLVFSNSTKQELAGTFSLISSLVDSTGSLVVEVNSTSSLEFGLPLSYVNVYSEYYAKTGNSSYSNSIAYSGLDQHLKSDNNSLGILYLNTFSQVWNNTLPVDLSLSADLFNMNATIGSLFPNANNPILTVDKSLYTFMVSISQNYSLLDYATGNNSAFYREYTLTTVETGLDSQASVQTLLNALDVNTSEIVSDSLNISCSNNYGEIYTLGYSLVARSSQLLFSSNPLDRINNSTILPFLQLLNDSNPETLVSSTINNETISMYPVLPTAYLRSNFVGTNMTSSLLILNFNENVSTATINEVVNTTDHYQKMIPGSQFLFTSSSAESASTSSQFTNGLIIALSIGISLSILLIGIFFKSPVAAFLPLLMFVFSAVFALGVNGILYKYVFHAQVSFITPTLLLILVLGLTTDYMVYMMARFRRELKKGNPNAAEEASRWSGHAVFTSGLTVTLSYIVLWLSNIPIFSDSGLTNAVGVAGTIILANTLLIALLSRYGRKIFWPNKYSLEGDIPLENAMKKVANFSVHNKKKIFAAFLILTVVSLFFYESTATGLNVFGLLPSSQSTQIIEGVNYTFGGDVLDRNFVVVEFPTPFYTNVSGNISFNSNDVAAINAIEQKILSQPGISGILGPTFPYGYEVNYTLNNISSSFKPLYLSEMMTFIGNNPHYVQIEITMKNLAWEPISTLNTDHLNTNLTALESSYNFQFFMGGVSQGLGDVFSYASSTFNISVPILIIAIFIVLFIQIFSMFTPLRLIAMVLVAVVVALSATYILIHDILHYSLIIFLPIFVVITLLAVGLDYDIFMITRVREEMLKGETTEQAITRTVEENGGVIITLGLLLFVTFISLSFTGIPIMYEIGVGLALGVLVDTFISWPFFVPVIMLYIQKYNWWPGNISKKP